MDGVKGEQKVAANILSTLSPNGKWIHRHSMGRQRTGPAVINPAPSGPQRKVISKFASRDQRELRLSLFFSQRGFDPALVTSPIHVIPFPYAVRYIGAKMASKAPRISLCGRSDLDASASHSTSREYILSIFIGKKKKSAVCNYGKHKRF